ncbi:MAG: antitoxin MazE family protein [Acidimicrobiales bacterium]
MADHETPPATRQRVADHRARLRRQGLRPVQIWVPDVRAPGFAAEAHRQSALAAASAHAAEDQSFVDAISWFAEEGDGEE